MGVIVSELEKGTMGRDKEVRDKFKREREVRRERWDGNGNKLNEVE